MLTLGLAGGLDPVHEARLDTPENFTYPLFHSRSKGPGGNYAFLDDPVHGNLFPRPYAQTIPDLDMGQGDFLLGPILPDPAGRLRRQAQQSLDGGGPLPLLLSQTDRHGPGDFPQTPSYPFTGSQTDSINPLKLREYLATGRPVAATALPEIVDAWRSVTARAK